MRVLLILPAIFGIALSGNQSSGEQKWGINGPPQGAHGPAVQQNHGAVGDPVAAKAGIQNGGPSGEVFDIPNGAHGPAVVQQHGYSGNPQINLHNGGSSNGNDAAGAGAAQNNPQVAPDPQNGAGDSSQGNDDAGGYFGNPQIIPSGGDSQDQDSNNNAMFGHVPPQSGVQQNAGSNFGGLGGGGNPGVGDSSNSVDQGTGGGGGAGYGGNPSRGDTNNGAAPVAPNAAPVAGGADVGVMAHQNYEAAGMSGAAVAGVVAGVVAVGAVGTAVAVVVLKSSASSVSAA